MACASTMAAISHGFCRYNECIAVRLDGGVLHISIAPDNSVIMRGPAEFVYEGETL